MIYLCINLVKKSKLWEKRLEKEKGKQRVIPHKSVKKKEKESWVAARGMSVDPRAIPPTAGKENTECTHTPR